jgi:hypothetical protein
MEAYNPPMQAYSPPMKRTTRQWKLTNATCKLSTVRWKLTTATCKLANVRCELPNIKCELANTTCEPANAGWGADQPPVQADIDPRSRPGRSDGSGRQAGDDAFAALLEFGVPAGHAAGKAGPVAAVAAVRLPETGPPAARPKNRRAGCRKSGQVHRGLPVAAGPPLHAVQVDHAECVPVGGARGIDPVHMPDIRIRQAQPGGVNGGKNSASRTTSASRSSAAISAQCCIR